MGSLLSLLMGGGGTPSGVAGDIELIERGQSYTTADTPEELIRYAIRQQMMATVVVDCMDEWVGDGDDNHAEEIEVMSCGGRPL
jgi:hypothetical protein